MGTGQRIVLAGQWIVAIVVEVFIACHVTVCVLPRLSIRAIMSDKTTYRWPLPSPCVQQNSKGCNAATGSRGSSRSQSFHLQPDHQEVSNEHRVVRVEMVVVTAILSRILRIRCGNVPYHTPSARSTHPDTSSSNTPPTTPLTLSSSPSSQARDRLTSNTVLSDTVSLSERYSLEVKMAIGQVDPGWVWNMENSRLVRRERTGGSRRRGTVSWRVWGVSMARRNARGC
jgi:hypothetical protein